MEYQGKCAICSDEYRIWCPTCGVNLCDSCALSVRWKIYRSMYLEEDEENKRKIKEFKKEAGDRDESPRSSSSDVESD